MGDNYYHNYNKPPRGGNPIQTAIVMMVILAFIWCILFAVCGCQSRIVSERNWDTLQNGVDTLAEGANSGKGLTPAECADTAEVMGAALADSPTVCQQVKIGLDTAGGLLPAPWGMILTTVSGAVTILGGAMAKRRLWDIPNEINRAEEVAEIDPALGKVGTIDYDNPKTKVHFKRHLSAAAFKKLYPQG